MAKICKMCGEDMKPTGNNIYEDYANSIYCFKCSMDIVNG